MRGRRDLFRDESGFTTTSMVLSLLITLSLLFTAAQVYRINSASAEVQDVADAAALSAENQVAEFMLVVRFCDAVVLSMSLTGLAVGGLGIAALCTPFTAELSGTLLDLSTKIMKARNTFATRSAKALNKLQEALPYFSAACAAAVARANDGTAGSQYLGVAILMPIKGEEITVDTADSALELLSDANDQAEEIREKAKRAEEATKEANRSKERAFRRDCGDAPDYCMYERAERLAGLSGAENPLYTSVEAWTFSVALARAKAYYRARLQLEYPADSSIDEQARSALRSHFYRFVVDELRGAYVRETSDSFEANIPHLPSNTSEMKATSLYTDEIYPVTESDDEQIMHAWMGCPEIQGREVVMVSSIAYMDENDLKTCPACGFTPSSMGKVAAASTSISNGFEYHYDAVADEAFLYQKARHEADQPKSEVKELAGNLLERLGDVLKECLGKRIKAAPPGRDGAIAFVVNAGSTSAAGGFASSFVSGGGSLGPRAAVSAATLVDEGTDEGRTALNSMLDGLKENGGFAVGALGVVLDVWSAMLVAYSDGQQAVAGAIEKGLNSVPLVGESGLGTWAADKLKGAIEGVGLEPAEVGALKPVLVNSGHVAGKAEDGPAQAYMTVKQTIIAHPLMSTDLFSSVLTEAEATALSSIEGLGDSVEIASIELSGSGGVSIPITIPLPDAAKEFGVSAVQEVFARLRSFYVEVSGARVWE